MSTISEEAYQFKNLILSDKYLDEQSKLAAIIGVNDNEEPILFDFAKHPHLFIGGDQGCGKSTLIHSIIMSLMQRNTPDEFQFVYLDPKGLDVNLYNRSKYLHINGNHNVIDIFDFLLRECNDRSRFLSENQKKTVSSYNEFAALCDDVAPIPELFVIIDEVSYLLEENKISQYIREMYDYGRMLGIHLIIADTNPTLSNVLRIAKLIPNKIVFRFTYADYKALLERKNVVPLSDDGEILCDFRGAEYVHGHACFVSEDEIKVEVAKNIVEIKEKKQVKKKKAEPKEVLQPIEETEIVENQMPYEALKNKETLNARDYPEYSEMLKELGIVDIDKVTEPQKITVTKVEHKAKLLGISEELAEFYGDITLNVCPATDEQELTQADEPQELSEPEEDKPTIFQRFTSRIFKYSKVILLSIFILITILLIAGILNSTDSDLNIFTVIIVVIAFYAIISLVTKDKKKRSETGVKYNIYAIDRLADGHDFEYVVADLLRSVGFYNVRVTVGSGDYGIDVVGEYDGASYAIQCKKYSGKVGVSAVQEAFAGRSYYGCNYAMVITNNYFTPAAIKLARTTGVILWDRRNVIKLINGHI